MKAALGDKLAVPFRQPPGIKTDAREPADGAQATPGEKDTVMEAFKPTEEPDDEYSVIGFTNESGTFVDPGADRAAHARAPARVCGEAAALH